MEHWAKLLGPSDAPTAEDKQSLAARRDPMLLNPPQPDTTEFDYPVMTISDAQKLAEAMRRESSDALGEVPGAVKEDIYDEEALERHLSQVQYQAKKVVVANGTEDNDDFRIETRFHGLKQLRREAAHSNISQLIFVSHELTTIGAEESLKRLESIGLPFTRPSDFYAEMLKSDQQMHKVRKRIETDRSKIVAVERRKKHKVEKMFSKKVQAEKIKQKQQQKNKNLQKIEEWKQSKFKTPLN